MKPIREAQKKETQRKIRQSISQLVQEKSYESITIREICQQAQISVGSYYNYYRSKDDIIFKAMEHSALVTRDQIRPLLNKKSGLENLGVYLQLQLDLFEGVSLAWLREIFRSYLYRLSDVILDRNSVNYETILETIQQGQKDRSIRDDIEEKALAWIVLKMIIANFYCYGMEEGNFDLRKVLVEEVMALCASCRQEKNEGGESDEI